MNADEKTCPFCGESIKTVAVRCRYCHADLTATAPTLTSASPVPAAVPTESVPPLPAALEAGQVLDLLSHLVDKNLVAYEEDGNGQGRYRLLETVRQYARDRLIESSETEALRGRHYDWLLGMVEQAQPLLRGPDQVQWLDRIESAYEDLSAALDWSSESTAAGPEAELRLAVALVLFWTRRTYLREGRHALARALSRSDGESSPLRMRALLGAGSLAGLDGDFAGSLAGLQEGLDLARAMGDAPGAASALATLAMRASLIQENEQASELAEEGLVHARAAGDPLLLAHCLHVLGWVSRCCGDHPRAAVLFSDSLALLRQLGDRWELVFVLLNRGGLAQSEGDYDSARGAYQEALTHSQALRDQRGSALCLECLAEVAVAQHQPERGAWLLGAAEKLISSIGAAWPPGYRAGRERALEAMGAALGDTASRAASEQGWAMTLEQVIAYLEAPDA